MSIFKKSLLLVVSGLLIIGVTLTSDAHSTSKKNKTQQLSVPLNTAIPKTTKTAALTTTQATTQTPTPTAVSTETETTKTPLPSSYNKKVDSWYSDGQARLQHNLAQAPNNKPAKNVILFVGDGMSVATVTATRILQGQLNGETGEEHVLPYETFPYSGFSKTYNTNSQTPDSAGTATAMLSGVKTKIGVVGLNDNVIEKDCQSKNISHVPTLLEIAEQKGLRTGIISTARITHATPAAAYAHSASRGWEAQAPDHCDDIAKQLINFNHGDGIEVILGGGRRSFIPSTERDIEYPTQKGKREDKRNLINEWKAKDPTGRIYFSDLKGFNKYQIKSSDTQSLETSSKPHQYLGLFQPSHMKYEADRGLDIGGEPSIAEMTEFAVTKLKQNQKGFFLLVEGGRIDHAHHGGNAYRALHDSIAFADAVKKADELTDDEDTLIIVTADHGHVFEMAGYAERGNPILGKAKYTDPETGETVLFKDATGKPYTTLGYLNGPGYTGKSNHQEEGVKEYPHQMFVAEGIEKGRPDLTDVDTEHKDYLQEAGVPLSSETHSGVDVPVYAKGPAAHLLTGVYEQNYIYHVMQYAFRFE